MISSIANVGGRVPDVSGAAAPSASDRAAVAQAVGQLNGSKLVSSDRELSLSIDPRTHELVIQVLDRQTKDVVNHFPAAQILDMAAALSSPQTPQTAADLPTYA
jgi:uncharacterized FlaG/YvyC family protein